LPRFLNKFPAEKKYGELRRSPNNAKRHCCNVNGKFLMGA
jgi:hypothetical protein